MLEVSPAAVALNF